MNIKLVRLLLTLVLGATGHVYAGDSVPCVDHNLPDRYSLLGAANFRAREKPKCADRKYAGTVNIQGTLFAGRIYKGHWHVFAEQAAVLVMPKSKSDISYITVYDNITDGKFQVLEVNSLCAQDAAEFVPLPHECVVSEKWHNWVQIQNLLQPVMKEDNFKKMKLALEEYLRQEKVLF